MIIQHELLKAVVSLQRNIIPKGIFGFMYSRKRISQNSFPNFIYLFPKSEPTVGSQDVIIKKYSTSHPGLELRPPESLCHWTIKAENIMYPQSCPCQDPS